MSTFRQFTGRIKLQLRRKNHVVGWHMTSGEAIAFIRDLGKTVLTFFGYSGRHYEDDKAMLQIAQAVLSEYSPETTLVNIGATKVGVGEVYPLAKSLGFVTTGVVSTRALKYPEDISEAVDHICFVLDNHWGGKLPDSNKLSPTSEAMVACSDILVAIGGNEISRDELLAGQALGKPIQYYPAEMSHDWAIRYAKKQGLPPPESFLGAVHEVFRDFSNNEMEVS